MTVELHLAPDGDDSPGVSLLAAPIQHWQPHQKTPDEPNEPWSAEALRRLQDESVVR